VQTTLEATLRKKPQGEGKNSKLKANGKRKNKYAGRGRKQEGRGYGSPEKNGDLRRALGQESEPRQGL